MVELSSLPSGIILDILSRLPIESVLESKSVCKEWENLVHLPCFPRLHFNNHKPSGKLSFVFKSSGQLHIFEYNDDDVDDDDKKQPLNNKISKANLSPKFQSYYVVGSCNGIICISGHEADFYICNPIRKEYVILPEVKKPEIPCHDILKGFGYLPKSKEYKVVRICESKKENPIIKHIVEVYTLGSGNGWRTVGEYTSDVSVYNICLLQGTLANGILHWVTEDRMIVAFDLADEKFCAIPAPPIEHDYDTFPRYSLGVLSGFLCFSIHDEDDGETSDVWLLKKHGNGKVFYPKEDQSWSWSKEFSLVGITPLALMKSGAVLCFSGAGLISYDPNSSCSKMLVNYNERIYHSIAYSSSSVSLKALGEEDTETLVLEENENII